MAINNEIDQIPANAQAVVHDYNTDFLRLELHESMNMRKDEPVEDQYLINNFKAKLTRLKYLENVMDEIAHMLNCSKDDVLCEVVSSEKMRQLAEKAQDQLKSEKENYERSLMDFRNEVTRATQLAESAVKQCQDLTAELVAIEEGRERTGIWEKIVGSITGKNSDAPEKNEEEIESEAQNDVV